MLQTTRHIPALDLCRGLAALVVFVYHVDFLIFGRQVLFSRGYLCVDFFFLLSGYVIAASYEDKLRKGTSFTEFMRLRLARLWPLVALTTLLGLIVQLPRWHRAGLDLDPISVAATTLLNAAMLPSPVSPNTFLFPINGAAWSIFFEMIANLAFVLLLPILTSSTLSVIIGAGAAGLIGAALLTGGLDGGWSVSNFVIGFPRVGFSFFLGVALYRRSIAAPQHLRRGGPALLMAMLVLMALLLNVPSHGTAALNGMIDVAIVIFAAPALIWVAIGARLGAIGNAGAWFFGGSSYSLYLLQTPLLIGYSALPQIFFHSKIAEWAPWGGLVLIALTLPVSFLCWRYFEQPMQRWLRGQNDRQYKTTDLAMKAVADR